MSNYAQVNDDEQTDNQDVVSTDEEQVDAESSDNADAESSKSSEQSTQEKEKEAHKELVYQGMIDSWTSKIANHKATYEDMNDPKMRSIVKARIDGLKTKPVADDDKLFQKFEARMELKKLLNNLPDEDKGEAEEDYKELLAIGKTPDQAVKKLQRFYDLKTDEEMEQEDMSFGQRTHKVSGGSTSVKSSKKYTKKESNYLTAMGVKL